MAAPFAELKLESMRLMSPVIYVTSHKPLVSRQPPAAHPHHTLT
jgi:hypothetical protein